MEKLHVSLMKYEQDLYEGAGVEVISKENFLGPDIVIMAVEEMFGWECGGHFLGDALEEWLSQPSETRKPIKLEDLERKWKNQELEIAELVKRDR